MGEIVFQRKWRNKTYASANGLIMWMTEDRKTLKDFENNGC